VSNARLSDPRRAAGSEVGPSDGPAAALGRARERLACCAPAQPRRVVRGRKVEQPAQQERHLRRGRAERRPRTPFPARRPSRPCRVTSESERGRRANPCHVTSEGARSLPRYQREGEEEVITSLARGRAAGCGPR